MKKILFITTRDPYAKRFSGDILRSRRIIKLLRNNYAVDVLFLGKKEKFLKKKNITFCFKSPNFLSKLYYCLVSFLKLQPIQFGLFYSSKLKKYVQQNAKKYDVIFFHTNRSVQYLPDTYEGKTILEMGDLYSKNYSQTYKHVSILSPLFYYYLVESFLIKKFENNSLSTFKNIILFSKKEISQIKRQFKKKIIHIPESVNEIKMKYIFSKNNYKILFIGNLGYLPNKLACKDFLKRILPHLSLKFPEIEFHIIGHIPAIDKFILSLNPKVKIIGQKKKIDKYMKKTICGLANLKIASGVQGKVLTYMSFGLPAICSDKVSPNFGSATIQYKDDKELIKKITNLKLNKFKSELFAKKSRNYIKNFLWSKIGTNYIRLINNSF
ncbi:MAG: Glycosyltransferase involved in cell wall bisynthesis [Pelagibacterales bacterium]|nr:Glycosyltransferase involved in cell wall bisynthesis [Pelagibacterales bacterium]